MANISRTAAPVVLLVALATGFGGLSALTTLTAQAPAVAAKPDPQVKEQLKLYVK